MAKRVEILIDPSENLYKVIIDGKEVKHLSFVKLKAKVNEIPKVKLGVCVVDEMLQEEKEVKV